MTIDLEALALRRAEEQLAAGAWRAAEAGESTPIPVTVQLKDHPSDRCAARGCNRKPRARGFCDTHYRIARRQGLTEREARAARRGRA